MSIKESKAVGFDHHHAVVIGAGMAGLLAGRILSDHFDSVTFWILFAVEQSPLLFTFADVEKKLEDNRVA